MTLQMRNYTVIRDTREKQGYGWIFDTDLESRRSPRCAGTIEQKLDNGDYTVQGYGDILAIERKKDFSELWTDYQDRKKFEEKMHRMSEIKHAFIIIETSLTTDHFNLSPPQFKKPVPGKALINWVMSLGIKYNIKILMTGQCGHAICKSIFCEVVRNEKSRWVNK